VFFKKLCPFIVEKHAIGLKGIIDGLTTAKFFFMLDSLFIEIQSQSFVPPLFRCGCYKNPILS
jgi:hypothetical protein